MTISFTTVDATGEPLAHYQVPDRDHLEANISKGIAHVIGELPANSYYKSGAWVRKPEQPSNAHQWNKATKQWSLKTEIAWEDARIERNRLLKDTDWLVTKAIETNEPMPAGLSSYRQALRDITEQSDPTAIVWPVKPT